MIRQLMFHACICTLLGKSSYCKQLKKVLRYCTISFELTKITAHKMNQPAYFDTEYLYISRTTPCTNTEQVPACSREPVDSTDANILWRLQLVWRQYGKKRQLSPSNCTGPCSAAPQSVQSSYHYENILQIWEFLGHHIDAKISPKAASEKAQTAVFPPRQWRF